MARKRKSSTTSKTSNRLTPKAKELFDKVPWTRVVRETTHAGDKELWMRPLVDLVDGGNPAYWIVKLNGVHVYEGIDLNDASKEYFRL